MVSNKNAISNHDQIVYTWNSNVSAIYLLHSGALNLMSIIIYNNIIITYNMSGRTQLG